MKDGQYVKEGKWQGCRWCETHQQHHGPLYACESYPLEVREEIGVQSANFVKSIPKIEDPAVRTIMSFFAGL